MWTILGGLDSRSASSFSGSCERKHYRAAGAMQSFVQRFFITKNTPRTRRARARHTSHWRTFSNSSSNGSTGASQRACPATASRFSSTLSTGCGSDMQPFERRV
ncbi:hypothetical protein EXIGLDRAFT_516321 [Exidia glandulosa HHB12029]|uniref:Uncharacterized protein n=1 Tax=Exidia glandulosa HHB12029 TaxID=1314781 RepID=A0A166N359_EXIGL|nr:hypothetical protein EXIGLDRAFT_516321 [Exidia glandulosa HHB12029]